MWKKKVFMTSKTLNKKKKKKVYLVPTRNQNLFHQQHEWNCSLPSITYCWWSSSSHLLPLSHSVTFTACSLVASPCMPAVVLYYCTFQGTVRLKTVVCLFAFYVLCEKHYKPTTIQYYISNYISWVPRLTLLDLQTNWTCRRTLRMELVYM